MKTITVKKIKDLKGEITVPGDKSISHRALMFASIAEGETRIKGLLKGEDVIATLKAFKQMGVWIDEPEPGIGIHGSEDYLVKGVGLSSSLREAENVIDAGNSGTTIRLMTGLLAGQDFFSVMTGDKYLRERPMKRVIEPLTKMGAGIFGRDGGNKAPLAIVGSKLTGITYNSPIASAQVKSAILLAGLYADGVTTVIEPSLSRDHTERMLKYFGAEVKQDGTAVSIRGGQTLKGGKTIEVPGDISSSAFFIVAALITEGSTIAIRDVGVNPTRTGVIDILRDMGGNIEVLNPREVSGEPIGDIYVKSSSLKGIEIKGNTIARAIDELPIVAVAAAFADGVTTIKDAKELRVKETDRIAAMADQLNRIGIQVQELEDGMKIWGGNPRGSDTCSSWGDHRIAMSMAVAGLAADGETCIANTDCIDTSFPRFTDLMKTIGAEIKEIYVD